MALPLSTEARTALARSNREYTTRIEIVRGAQLLASTDDGTLKAVDGGISFDGSRDIVGESRFVAVIDSRTAGLVPLSATDTLSPVSPTSVRITPGARLATGAFEYVQVATFDLATTEVDEGPGGLVVECQSYDRHRGLDRADFTDVVTIAAGTNYITAIKNLITPVYPSITFIDTPTAYTTPMLTYDVGESRLGAVKDMAASIGYEVRFDPSGNCLIRPVNTAATPVWSWTEGVDAVVMRSRRRLTDERVYNGVIVRGESFGTEAAPVEGSAWDTDPLSPTYYDPANPGASTYGPVPFFFTSEYITTSTQANEAAAARLPKVKGLIEQVEIEVGLNPAIQEGDITSLIQARSGLSGIYVVESIDYSFNSGSMRVRMQERRL